MDINWGHVIGSLIYSGIGIVMFAVAYLVLDKLLPFSFHKEIGEDQNIALGIILGCVALALAIIIHGAIV